MKNLSHGCPDGLIGVTHPSGQKAAIFGPNFMPLRLIILALIKALFMTYKIKNIRVIWTEMGKIVENLKSGLKLRKIKKYTDMKMEKMEKSGN